VASIILKLNDLPKTKQDYEHVKEIDRETEMSTGENKTNIIKNTKCEAPTI